MHKAKTLNVNENEWNQRVHFMSMFAFCKTKQQMMGNMKYEYDDNDGSADYYTNKNVEIHLSLFWQTDKKKKVSKHICLNDI